MPPPRRCGSAKQVDGGRFELLYRASGSKNRTSFGPPSFAPMALTQRLQLRQSQALVMTPQLMQLSNLDLAAYVDAELERNPLLDRGAENEAAPAEAESQAPHEAPKPDAWGDADAAGPDAHDGQPQPAFDDNAADGSEPIRPRTDLPAGYSEWAGVGAGGRDDSDYNLQAFVSAGTTPPALLRGR